MSGHHFGVLKIKAGTRAFWLHSLILLFVVLFLSPHTGHSSNQLTESWVQAQTETAFILIAEHSYFSQDFDVIGYLDSLEGSSRPKKYSQSVLSLAYKFETWHPFIEYREVSGSVERSSQPFEVESNADYWGVGLAYSTGDADGGGSAVFSLTSATQDDFIIDCYERSGVVLGGACEEAD